MFSKEWEDRFAEGKSHCVWPWSDLISYNSRYGYSEPGTKILELGPGIGSNIPYFLSLGFDYYAIEGSKTAVSLMHEKFPSLKEKIVQGDFTQKIPFDCEFDLVVDRSALTHNDSESIVRCLGLIRKKLTQNGKFIGIDWFSWSHGQRQLGYLTVDPFTFTFRSGKFADYGKVHFSTPKHLIDLFHEAQMKIILMDHKVIHTIKEDSITDPKGTWNLVAVKE